MPSSPLSSAPEDGQAEQDSRRRSGRVSRKPQHFEPAPVTHTSAKRKRNQAGDVDDDDGDNDDVESDQESATESSDDSQNEPDNDNAAAARAPKKRAAATRKPAAKRPKTNGASHPAMAKSKLATSTQRSRRKAKNIDRADAQSATGLYAEVFKRGGTIKDAITQWLKRFEQHESRALADLINFALRCAGCELEITDHDIADPDACTTKLGDLQDEFQAQNVTEYPIIAKSKRAADFKTSLTDFFHDLIRATHDNDILFSRVELIENLARWLTGMASAQNRPFRHTATVISIAITSALCEIGRDLRATSAKSLRHSESEKKNKRVNKDRVNAIRQDATVAANKQELCDTIVEDWFTTVFIHRYRDVDFHIRVDCAAGLGEWILAYPDVFLDDAHLRYLGWLLSDAQATVRHEVIKQLHRLYKDQGRLSLLKTFTERFRSRFVEMATSDSEINVRTEAIKILDIFREAGYLEPDNIDIVGRLIFDAEPRIRNAVAPFFAASVNDAYDSKLDDLGGQQALEEELPDSSGPNSLNLDWLRLKCLAEMLQAYDETDSNPARTLMRQSFGDSTSGSNAAQSTSRFVIAAEALQSQIDVIEEFELLSGYLLYDSSETGQDGAAEGVVAQLKEEIKLSNEEEIIIAEVFYMSIKSKLASVANEDTLDKTKKKPTKRQREEDAEERESIQRLLASLLPKLLKRFEHVAQIALIVLRLDREVFGAEFEPDASTYTAFLNDVKNQFLTQNDELVINEASGALLRAKDSQEFGEHAEEMIDELWQDLTGKLTAPGQRDLAARGNMSASTLSALAKNVYRIRRLATISPAVEHLTSVKSRQSSSALDRLIACIGRGVKSDSGGSQKDDPEKSRADDDLALNAAGTVSFYFLWTTAGMITKLSSPTGRIAEDHLVDVAKTRDDYISGLVDILDSRKPREAVSAAVAGHILDMHATFSTLRRVEAREDRGTEYLVLALDIDQYPTDQIVKIFTACEKRYGRLWNKTIETISTNKNKPRKAARQERPIDADPIDEDEDLDDNGLDPTQDPEDSDDDQSSDSDDLDADSSDADDDLDEEPNRAILAARKQSRLTAARLVAEQRLCELAAKMVLCLLAGMFPDPKRVRKHLELNKTKLGANYRHVITLLEENDPVSSTSASGKAKAAKLKGKLASAGGRAAGAGAGVSVSYTGKKAISAERIDSDEDADEDENEEDEDDEDEEVEGGAEEQGDDLEEQGRESPIEDEIESVLGD